MSPDGAYFSRTLRLTMTPAEKLVSMKGRLVT
jgi:hypothetical protein